MVVTGSYSNIPRILLFFCDSSEDQVCPDTGYDCLFGVIGLAVLSGLGRR